MRAPISSRTLYAALLFLILAVHNVGAIPGDVDNDGALSLVDVAMIEQHLDGLRPLTAPLLSRADANSDGKVDAADIIRVRENLSTSDAAITISLPGGVTMDFVRIPAGNFTMGAPVGERSSHDDERPTHTVTIAYSFYMGKTEVTQAQWQALMRSNPAHGYGMGADYPVYYVSWNDCQSFVLALNDHITSTGQGPATFRLPREAEWEYACRAGTQTRFFFGDSLSVGDDATDGLAGALPGNRSDYMWFGYNSNTPTCGMKPVATKWPNQFGLYDMSGNVWEWCQDYWHNDYTGAPSDGSAWESPTSGDYRALRGGDWHGVFDHAYNCRSAYRSDESTVFSGGIGFRLARTQ